MTEAYVVPSSTAASDPAPDFFSSLKLLMRHRQGVTGYLVAAIAVACLAVVLELVPVWVIWKLVSALVSSPMTDAPLFTVFAIAALAAVVLGTLFMGLALGLSHIAAFRLIHSLRLALSRRLARLPMGWFQGRRSGGAKKLIVDEPERLELIIAHGLPEGVSAVGAWIAVTVWLFAVDWRMAMAATILAPISFAMIIFAMSRASGRIGEYQRRTERMNGAIVEFLAGMPVVKVFNRTGAAFDESAKAVTDYTAIETEMGKSFVPLGSAFYTLVAANITVILPVGLWMMQAGEISLPVLCLFVILGANYSQPLLKLYNLFHNLAHISMASTLIEEVLAMPEQPDSGKRLDLASSEISFSDVSFGYGSHDVVHGVSFTAAAGQMTALVGPSGSGKSTLAGLIPRLHDPRTGKITLGGADLRDIGLDQLMEQVAFVFQQTFLFSGTVGSNIRFGKPDASQADVEVAARAARAHDFIMALPDGYDTRLGEGGATLSGGERQRIAIARAILKDAPVIVLDEATAFADPDSEAAIQEALNELAKGRTLIVVAHRLQTIMNADRIVVLEGGRVAEQGRHDDLLAARGLYARLWADFSAAQAIPLRSRLVEAGQ